MSATLANLTTNGYGLNVFCRSCCRCASADVLALVSRFGPSMPLPAIGERSRCRQCGAKGADVQIQAVEW